VSFRLVRHLGGLPLRDLVFIGRVTWMVVGVRAALWVLPYRRVTRLMGVEASLPPSAPLTLEALRRRRRIVSYTAGVSRRLLGDKPCLVQALVAHRLLREIGQPTVLRIGVSRGEGHALRAHAWLEDGGHVVIGSWGPEMDYIPLRPLAAA
jgi:hypothetical protein